MQFQNIYYNTHNTKAGYNLRSAQIKSRRNTKLRRQLKHFKKESQVHVAKFLNIYKAGAKDFYFGRHWFDEYRKEYAVYRYTLGTNFKY